MHNYHISLFKSEAGLRVLTLSSITVWLEHMLEWIDIQTEQLMVTGIISNIPIFLGVINNAWYIFMFTMMLMDQHKTAITQFIGNALELLQSCIQQSTSSWHCAFYILWPSWLIWYSDSTYIVVLNQTCNINDKAFARQWFITWTISEIFMCLIQLLHVP